MELAKLVKKKVLQDFWLVVIFLQHHITDIIVITVLTVTNQCFRIYQYELFSLQQSLELGRFFHQVLFLEICPLKKWCPKNSSEFFYTFFYWWTVSFFYLPLSIAEIIKTSRAEFENCSREGARTDRTYTISTIIKHNFW